MKRIYLSVCAMALSGITFGQAFFEYTDYRGAFAPAPTAPWTDSWTNWDPQNTVYQPSTVTVANSITTDTYWSNDQVYLLQGQIYVKAGAVLTIQEGTVILGDKSSVGAGLFITKGSKLNALGTAAKPIVFTSNQPAGSRDKGDWGGLVILGKAATNVPGGVGNIEGIAPTSDTEFGGGLSPVSTDNSGDIHYVRVEFGGYIYAPNKEINGVTFGAVGSGTSVHHVQVSFSNDDSFEWFGGAVNCKYLVSFRSLDDDFDTDNGYSGNVQFGLSVRDPQIADNPSVSSSEGFESDNDAAGSSATPQTSAIFSNITLVGPLRGTVGSTVATGYRRGARLRRNSAQKLYNCIFIDHLRGIHIDGLAAEQNAVNGDLKVKNCIFAGNTTNLVCETSSVSTGTPPVSSPSAFTTIRTWFGQQGNDSVVSSANILITPYDYLTPDYRPTATSIALQNVNHDLASLTSGIIELNSFGSIELFPNPAQNEASLSISTKETINLSIVVYNVTGKVVANVFDGVVADGNSEFKINTSEFTNGMYYVTMNSELGVKTIKLSVSK